MKESERIATFTFDVPLRFSFDALADTEPEMLLKMADSYIDLVLKSGKFDIREKGLNLVKVEKHFTKEELEERKRAAKAFDEFFGEPLTNLGQILNIKSLRG